MAQDDFWNRLAGPFGEQTSRIGVALFDGVTTDIIMGGGIEIVTARAMLGITPESEEADEYDDLLLSIETITSVPGAAFPGGTEQSRQLVVNLARAIASISIVEVNVPGNPYVNGASVRVRVGEFIEQTGGTLVGSMALGL